MEFIDTNKNLLGKSESRRYSRIFKLMALFIKTRGADQCRSHHQKKQKKFKTLANIILNCQQMISKLSSSPSMITIKESK